MEASASSCLVFTFILAFLLFMSNIQNSVASSSITPTKRSSDYVYKNFLKTACNSTTYPTLCYKSLSSYTSTIKTNNTKLCITCLTISLKAARNASSFITSVSKQKGLNKTDAAIIRDCIEELGDAVDELKQSLKALDGLKGSVDVEFQIDNIKTWVSAAITDENTCTDGFDGTKTSAAVRSKIRKSIVNVARLTSNALALINKLTY